MKVDYLWLCDYLKHRPPIDELIYNLKKIGFGIESVKRFSVDCSNVITAKVVSVEKHPNADRLKICHLTTGKDEYDVVCGASNVEKGLVVPLALVGARVKDITIKRSKIRGVESNGMICSAEELGLEERSDGILTLDENTPLGVDIRDLFEEDYIIDIEITPNLAYCLSHYGLARELSIFAGYEFIPPDLNNLDFVNESEFKVEVKTPNCFRYMGIVIRGIKNKKTPEFILNRLKKIGINPKGNLLIDLSNYVMFDIGEPNHFFDLSKVDSIVVRQAFDHERIRALDGNVYDLSPEIMVIADSKRAVAVAGVIGGADSAIDDDTSDVFVEIANFKPQSIRLSSKNLSIKTDSSYRFERGVDYEIVEISAKRIISLIKSTNPDAKIAMVKDIKNIPYTPKIVDIDVEKIESILGIEVDLNSLNLLLKRMDDSFDGKRFKVPSYRYDISSIWDISEEYLRYVGYDSIRSKTTMPIEKTFTDVFTKMKEEISLKLLKFGFNECYTYDLVSESDISLSGFEIENSVRLLNPISRDFEYLRISGIPSMLKVLRHNINRDVNSVFIYEFGSVFSKVDGRVDERRKIFLLMWGSSSEWEWWKDRNRKVDFFDFKSAVDAIFNYENIWEGKQINRSFLYGGVIKFKNAEVGWGGEIRKEVLKKFDIKENGVFYAEIDLDVLSGFYDVDFYRSIKRPKKPSPYQCGIRDLSIVVSKKYSYSDILSSIDRNLDIHTIELIDVYEDAKFGADKRSLTFRFVFSSNHKTFTDEELNERIERIFLNLKEKFSASLR